MRVLGCLDGTNTRPIGEAVQMFFAIEPLAIAFLTVIDVGPRGDLDRLRERFGRPPMHHQPVTDEMMAAEKEGAQETLNAGLVYVKNAETLLRQNQSAAASA